MNGNEAANVIDQHSGAETIIATINNSAKPNEQSLAVTSFTIPVTDEKKNIIATSNSADVLSCSILSPPPVDRAAMEESHRLLKGLVDQERKTRKVLEV